VCEEGRVIAERIMISLVFGPGRKGAKKPRPNAEKKPSLLPATRAWGTINVGSVLERAFREEGREKPKRRRTLARGKSKKESSPEDVSACRTSSAKPTLELGAVRGGEGDKFQDHQRGGT